MIGKKINQLATELAPTTTDLTIIGDPVTGVSKKITLEQLGAIFGGAVSFYTTLGDFPATGVIDIIYCAKDTKKLYLWSGSAYVEVFPSQSLLDTYQLRSEKGVSNGYASLDVNGKVPIGQLPNSIMEYKGTWNAATNTPTLANGTGDTGDVYICNAAGTVNFGAGPITFAVGDYVVYSGTIWQRSSGAVGTVTSVGLSITGDSIGVTGSPITTSGTLALAFAGTGAQYIKGDGTLATFPSIISQAQNLVTEVYNNTGATLTKGTIVYINGGQGNLPTVTKALATGDSTSAQTYGVVQTDITNMNNGYVVVAGRLTDLDTQAYSNGTQLYLSSTTAGTWTPTKQYAPNHLVYVGIVVRAHPTQGVVEVKIQNGYEMDELHNVAAQSPDNNDILQYKTATSLWTKVAGTTTNIAEGTNLYYTEARVNANTNVAANTAARHNAVTIGTANGLSLSTQVLSLALASSSTTGALSSTDWNTFNNKQNTITNPITGTGVSGRVAFFNDLTSITSSTNFFWDATNNRLGIGLTNPQRSLEIFNSTADAHLRLSGTAPSVSLGEAITGSIYQAKFGLITANGQYVSGGVAGDFVIISQTGATIFATSSTEKMRVQSSGNVSINNTNDTYKLDVTGTARLTGQLRLESTITDGTYTYTLPSATGTLALTSALSGMITGSGTTNYLPKFTGTSTIGNSAITDDGTTVSLLSRALSGTSATFSSSVTANTFVEIVGDLRFNSTSADRSIYFRGSAGSVDTNWKMGNYLTPTGATVVTSAATVIDVYNGAGYGFMVRNTSNAPLLQIAGNTGAATFSSSVTATSGNFSDTITSTIGNNANVLRSVSATTGYQAIQLANTGGNGVWVLGSSTGTNVFSNGSAYATQIGTLGDTSLQFGTNSFIRATITSSGNVGIGTTSPSWLLQLEKNSSGAGAGTYPALVVNNPNAAGYSAMYFFNGATNVGGLEYNNSTTNLVLNSYGALLFQTASGTERMRITSGGAVEMTGTIKTASPSSGSAHAWKLGSYAAGGTGTATGVIYIEVNGQIYSIPALLGTP
jgi:hypothetical protein